MIPSSETHSTPPLSPPEPVYRAAVARLRSGEAAAGEAALRELVAAHPEFAPALSALGQIALGRGAAVEALAWADRAAAAAPGVAGHHALRGAAYRALGTADLAVAAYRQAITLAPEVGASHYNLALSLLDMEDFEGALAASRQAITLRPDNAASHNTLGVALKRLRRQSDALAAFEAAIRLQPDYAPALANLGNLLRALGRPVEAASHLQAAHRANPRSAVILAGLGEALFESGRSPAAATAFARALAIKPDFGPALFGACDASLSMVYAQEADIPRAQAAFDKALARVEAWFPDADPKEKALAVDTLSEHQPFFLPYLGTDTTALQIRWGRLAARVMDDRMPGLRSLSPRPGEGSAPLRVAVVSGFLRWHSVWKLFRGWWKGLDRARFRVVAISTGMPDDPRNAIARPDFDAWFEGFQSFDEAVRVLRREKPDVILYPEIGMDPMTLQLAALRIAPVQAMAWGHPVTSGLPTIDYFLTSDLMEPSGDAHYSERLVRLPRLSIVYTPLGTAPEPVPLSAHGVMPEDPVFLCLQFLSKYLPQHDELLARIALRLPRARFLFIGHQRAPEVTEAFRRRLHGAFARAGLDGQAHVVILPRLSPEQYAGLNRQGHVYLDSIGWSGGNTTLEAIEAGLPVVTMPGASMRSRHSTAILSQMGLEAMIAQSADDYVARAVAMAGDPAARSAITANRHRLYDDAGCLQAVAAFLVGAVDEARAKRERA